MKKLCVTTAVLLLSGGVAMAQDDWDDGSDTSGGYSAGGSASVAPGGDMGGGGGGDYSMGIGVGLQYPFAVPSANILYNLGGNWLDLSLAFNMRNTSPEMGDGTTEISVGIAVGYRMYRETTGRIRPYLEPFVAFGFVNEDADPAKPIDIGLGAMLGVDFVLFDQLTVGAGVGAALDFQIAEGANTFGFGLFTTAINATFWW
jgi:hypothetical protein